MNFITFPLQLIAIAFLIFAFSRVWLRTREGSIGWGMFLFWILVWMLVLIAVIKPELMTQLAKRLGIGRGVDVALYISIVLLFYLNFRSNVMIENLRHEITRLTRIIALDQK
ncbi:DUF2304 family protein [Candidatus Collierbacteria bacterium]|nr:DUF2304 family protein [Candidatus Collierbacteria bacterium]